MAKLKPSDKPAETPLQRTRRLARKLVAVPKAEVDKVKAKQSQSSRRTDG